MTTETRPGRYEHCLINPNVPNTNVFVAPENLYDLGPLLATTLGFAGKVSRLMGQRFVSDFSRYQTEIRKRPLSPILDHLLDKQMHLPQFLVLDKEAAKVFLNEAGFKNKGIDKGHLLFVFQFPKPLAKFWKKEMLSPNPEDEIIHLVPGVLRTMLNNESLSGEDRERILNLRRKPMRKPGPKPIEWGRFKGLLKQIFWENTLQYQSWNKLKLTRVNEPRVHDPDLFYYILEASLPKGDGRNGNGNGRGGNEKRRSNWNGKGHH